MADLNALLDIFQQKLLDVECDAREFLDIELKKINLKIRCESKGCAACCYLGFMATLPEGLLAARAALAAGIGDIEARAAEMAARMAADKEPTRWFGGCYNPCLFLKTPPETEASKEATRTYVPGGGNYPRAEWIDQCCVDSECLIYPSRPSACRLHWVVSNPRSCRYDQADLVAIDWAHQFVRDVSSTFLREAIGSYSGDKLMLFPEAVRLGAKMLAAGEVTEVPESSAPPEAWLAAAAERKPEPPEPVPQIFDDQPPPWRQTYCSMGFQIHPLVEVPHWPVEIHTVCLRDTETVNAVIQPLIDIAKMYFEERSNGALADLAKGIVKPGDHRGLIKAAVRDFVEYVAHKHQVYVPSRSWWRK